MVSSFFTSKNIALGRLGFDCCPPQSGIREIFSSKSTPQKQKKKPKTTCCTQKSAPGGGGGGNTALRRIQKQKVFCSRAIYRLGYEIKLLFYSRKKENELVFTPDNFLSSDCARCCLVGSNQLSPPSTPFLLIATAL